MKKILALFFIVCTSSLFAGTGTLEISTITTAGNAVYFDAVAGKDVLFGTDGFFVNGTDGNIGIGTTSPASELHFYRNDTSVIPGVFVEQNSTGDASSKYYLTGGQNVVIGIDNDDGDNLKIGNSTSLTGTTYADTNTLMRVHTETNSEGIIDFNHQSRAYAYRNAVQSIGKGAWTKAEFNTENFDEKTEFDPTTNYRFTALEQGYYQVDSRVRFTVGSSGANDYLSIAIYKNGAIYSYGNNLAVGTSAANPDLLSNNSPCVSDIVNLAAGDYVEIYVFQNTNTNQDIVAGSSGSYVMIHKLS